MKPIFNLLALLMLGLISFQCNTPSTTNKPVNVSEVDAFMNTYAGLLRARDMEGIANLYYDSAIIMSGHGRSEILSFDSVKAYYMRSSREPVDFRWEKIHIEPLGTQSVLVTAVFYWNGAGPASYSGVFVKSKEVWKIKHEHESVVCK